MVLKIFYPTPSLYPRKGLYPKWLLDEAFNYPVASELYIQSVHSLVTTTFKDYELVISATTDFSTIPSDNVKEYNNNGI